MEKLPIQRGDVFCSANPGSRILGPSIRFIERFHSKDNEAIYGHSGIITEEDGSTIECLWTIKKQNLVRHYIGQQALIARPTETMNGAIITDSHKDFILKAIDKEYLGHWYPGWRLALHIVPFLAKHFHFMGMPVCSEFVAMYLGRIYARYEKTYWGVNPDTLADEWDQWKNFEIVFEGIIK